VNALPLFSFSSFSMSLFTISPIIFLSKSFSFIEGAGTGFREGEGTWGAAAFLSEEEGEEEGEGEGEGEGEEGREGEGAGEVDDEGADERKGEDRASPAKFLLCLTAAGGRVALRGGTRGDGFTLGTGGAEGLGGSSSGETRRVKNSPPIFFSFTCGINNTAANTMRT
jgi:hypothetical protein